MTGADTGLADQDDLAVEAGGESFGVLADRVLTVPAARMVAGANITCTFVNSLRGFGGVVFNDGGAPSGGANTGVVPTTGWGMSWTSRPRRVRSEVRASCRPATRPHGMPAAVRRWSSRSRGKVRISAASIGPSATRLAGGRKSMACMTPVTCRPGTSRSRGTVAPMATTTAS